MKPVLKVLAGNVLSRQPIWLMRQAGRYLPEYQKIRQKAGSFLNLVYNPILATEVTMQPIRRFGFDAAILFSDILVVPHAMGVDLTFETGEGPRLKPVTTFEDLKKLEDIHVQKIWEPVLETVRGIQKQLIIEKFDQTSLIGFAGAPWTIACYMISGSGKDHFFSEAKELALNDSVFFDALIEKITSVTILYLKDQIKAGAEIIQIFDSWASRATDDLYDRYVIAPTIKIIKALQAAHPQIPVIGFPRLSSKRTFDYIDQTGIRALQCDEDFDFESLDLITTKLLATQGNLDPEILLKGGKNLDEAIIKIKNQTSGHPHIFNLSHGIIKETPIAHVEQLMKHFRE